MQKIITKQAVLLMGVMVFSTLEGLAWHHHAEITAEALRVIPKSNVWGFYTTEPARAAIARAALIPDEWNASLSTSYGYFFANDYLLFPDCPVFAEHQLNVKNNLFLVHFTRVMQAFRTESPENICHRLGVLLHYAEDNCTPQHSELLMKQAMKNHFTEGWLNVRQIKLGEYQPNLLGKTEKEAYKAFEKRLLLDHAQALVLATELLPTLSGSTENIDRSVVEPRQLRAAVSAAQVAADLIYTVLVLGTQPVADGGGDIQGKVFAPAVPLRNDRLARVMLMSASGKPTIYDTLAMPAGSTLSHQWRGTFQFRNLPTGTYRVAVYRLGAEVFISEPITVKEKTPATVVCDLTAANPAGNLIENPAGKLSFVRTGVPDRWYTDCWFFPKDRWVSGQIAIQTKRGYRMGVLLKDPSVKVDLIFVEKGAAYATRKGKPLIVPLKHGETARAYVDATYSHACVEVLSNKPFAEIVENIWLIPE